MEYVYAALLLHNAKQPINEDNVKKVLTAAGVSADAAKAKALVSALDGVNIEEAVKQAAAAPVAVAATAGAPAAAAKAEEKKDDKSDAEKEAEAAAGLSALFG